MSLHRKRKNVKINAYKQVGMTLQLRDRKPEEITKTGSGWILEVLKEMKEIKKNLINS